MVPVNLKLIAPPIIAATVRRVTEKREAKPSEISAIVKEVAHDPVVERALDVKPWWRSKAVWGSLGVIFASVIPIAGIAITTGDILELREHLVLIFTGLSGLWSLYGRIAARQALT